MKRAVLATILLAGCSVGSGTSDEPNDSLAAATALGRVVSLSRAGVGGLGYYRFEAAVDGQLRLTLDLPSGADYDLALFDGEETRLATSRADNRQPEVGRIEALYAAVFEGETYTVEVRGIAGAVGRYGLAIEIGQPTESIAAAIGPLTRARSFHGLVALPDGRALVAGGTDDPSSQTAAILSALSTTELFEPATGTFKEGPDLGAARFALTATLLPTGRVLLAGGDLSATADLYDPARAIAKGIPMTGGVRALATATLLPDGRVLIAGGTTIVFSPLPTAKTLDTTTIFDPKTRTFAAGPPLTAPRTSHAATLFADGRVLLTGGVGRSDSEWIDGTTSAIGPTMNGVRDDHTATLLADGRLLLAGGQDATGRSLDSAELLDVGATTFRLLTGTMADRRADHQAVRLRNGTVLLFGGEDDPAGGPDVILTSVDRFDPATESFDPAAALRIPRDDHRVARLLDGRILVTGGEDATSTSLRDAEIYLPGE